MTFVHSTLVIAAKVNVLTEYLNKGGWMMYVILGVSIISFIIFLERVISLYIIRRLNAQSFIDRIVTLISHRKFREALEACEISTHHPLVYVAREGLLRAHCRDKEVERAMEKEMLSHLPKIRTRVRILSVLANVATLLGLLGTIFGLIMAFTSVSAASAAERQTALAAGISQAMYTTAFGISVAVPILLYHHFVSKRVENIIMEVENGASSILVAIDGAVRDDEKGGEPIGDIAEEGDIGSTRS